VLKLLDGAYVQTVFCLIIAFRVSMYSSSLHLPRLFTAFSEKASLIKSIWHDEPHGSLNLAEPKMTVAIPLSST